MDAPAVTLASLRAGQRLRGVLPGQPVTLVGVTPLDDALVEIFFRDDSGRTGERMITDADAGKLELVTELGNAPFDEGLPIEAGVNLVSTLLPLTADDSGVQNP